MSRRSKKPKSFNRIWFSWTSVCRNQWHRSSPADTPCPPKSQIIFLSQHDSLQMVKDALNVGGHGYVTKIDARLELLKAIRTVREGKQFVSQRIVSQGWRSETTGGVDA